MKGLLPQVLRVCLHLKTNETPWEIAQIYGNHLSKGHASFPECAVSTDWSLWGPKAQPFLLTQDNPEGHGPFSFTAPRCCLHCGRRSATLSLCSILLSLPQLLILYAHLCHRTCCPVSVTWNKDSFLLIIKSIIIVLIPIQVCLPSIDLMLGLTL